MAVPDVQYNGIGLVQPLWQKLVPMGINDTFILIKNGT